MSTDLEASLREATLCYHKQEVALREGELDEAAELERRRASICASWKLNMFYHGNAGKAIQNQQGVR